MSFLRSLQGDGLLPYGNPKKSNIMRTQSSGNMHQQLSIRLLQTLFVWEFRGGLLLLPFQFLLLVVCREDY